MGSNSPSEKQRIALVALGSNLGDSVYTIQKAMERLQEFSDEAILKSRLYGSAPVDCPPGSQDFINAAVALLPRAGETPETLLSKLKELEKEFGRKSKVVHNEPRPLDLDLLAFGDQSRATAELTLPHPRTHLRDFVLRPLNDIAPDFVLPGQAQTIREFLQKCGQQECHPLGNA